MPLVITDKLPNCVIPWFLVSGKNEFRQWGSALFLRYDSAFFLVTAAHVVAGEMRRDDPTKRNDNLVMQAWNGSLTETPDRWQRTMPKDIRGLLHRQWGSNVYPLEFGYDDEGRTVSMTTFRSVDAQLPSGTVDWTQPAWPTNAPVGDRTEWVYDRWTGLLDLKRYADYNATSNPTQLAYTFDSALRLATRTNGRGQTATYGYDGMGRLQGITYPAASNTPNVTFTFDRAGRPVTVTDGTGSRNLGYTAFDQLEDESYNSGLLAGRTIDRSYDSYARLSGLAVPDVTALSYGYDAFSRVETVTEGRLSGEVLEFAYAYQPGFDRVENLTSRRNGVPVMVAQRSYDSLGRLTGLETRNSSGAVLSRHGYLELDAVDHRTVVEREDGKQWHYDYNSRGEVTNAYKQFPASEGGERLGGWQTSYTYDTIGNRLTASSGGDGSGGNLRTGNYSTNSLNQYTQRTVPGSFWVTGEASPTAAVELVVGGSSVPATRQGAVGAQSFYYAEYQADNTTKGVFDQLRVRGSVDGYAPAAQLGVAVVAQTPEMFVYDADGNLTQDDRWLYRWDAENRLVEMETRPDRVRPEGILPSEQRIKLVFVYDAESRRISKKVLAWNFAAATWATQSDTRFVYDRWNVVAEIDATTSQIHSTYVWGLDVSGSLQGAGGVGGLLAAVSEQVNATLYCLDENGNVATLIDASTGVVSGRYGYDSFGNVLQLEGAASVANPYRFSCKYQDREIGLLYYGLRYYNPSAGRWLSRDPIGEEGGLNLFALVTNDAVNKSDYLGLLDGGASNTLRGLEVPFIPADHSRPIDPQWPQKMLAYRLTYNSDPLANRLLEHYMRARGATFVLSVADMRAVRAHASITNPTRTTSKKLFNDYLSEARSGGVAKSDGGGCWSCVTLSDLRVEGGARANGTLGGFTIIYNGELCVLASGYWKFSGTMSFYDYWNFEPHVNGVSQRSAYAHRAVDKARGLFIGTPFDVVSPRVSAEQSAGTAETIWSGYQIWMDSDAHNRHTGGDLR